MSISRRGLLAAVSGLAATGASGGTLSIAKLLAATGAAGAVSGANGVSSADPGVAGPRDPFYSKGYQLREHLYRHLKRTARQLARDGVLPQHGAMRSWSGVYKQRATDKKLDELMAAQDALENEDTLRALVAKLGLL